MCVVAFAWRAHPRWRLLLVGNRDEFHRRPSAALAPWPGSPVIAGRDLEAGGTWAGIDRHGRCAVVTNVRDGPAAAPAPRSRGQLPLAFLTSPQAGARRAVIGELLADAGQYAPFNLLLADGDQCRVLRNHPQPQELPVPPGIHGLTNGGFPSAWPKARALCAALTQWLDSAPALPSGSGATAAGTDSNGPGDGAPRVDALWAALQDRRPFPDGQLPDTGIGLALERQLSPVFIRGDDYGTRACTVIAIAHDGRGWIMERRFGRDGQALGETRLPIGPAGINSH